MHWQAKANFSKNVGFGARPENVWKPEVRGALDLR